MEALLTTTNTGGLDFSKLSLTMGDIIFAAFAAFFMTTVIQMVSRLFKAVVKPAEFEYGAEEKAKILQKCYLMFPNEIINFDGKVFKRGMLIRVKTIQNKIIEGKLIGLNSDNMVCMITSKHVIAQELDSIEEMVTIDA